MVLTRNANLARGDWILKMFDLKKAKVYYIEQIITLLPSSDGSGIIAKFLRRKTEKTFVWPSNKDVCELKLQRIVMVLRNLIEK